MNVELKVIGDRDVVAMLKALPAEVVSKRGGPVKSALRKGANVIAKAEREALQAVTSNATESGKKESTGFLQKHIIVSRGKAPTSGNGERYLVRIKRAAYVRAGNASTKIKKREAAGKRVTTLQTAQLLEYGSSHQPAEPFIRPAFLRKAAEAISTVETELLKGIDRIVKKLSKG